MKRQSPQTYREGLSKAEKLSFDNWVKNILETTRLGGGVGKVAKALRETSFRWQKEVLAIAIKKTRRASVRQELNALCELPESIFSKADQLNQLKDDAFRLWDNLDIKAKCFFVAMLGLFEMENCDGVRVDFGEELRVKVWRNTFIKAAQKEFPNDQDIAVVAKLTSLTDFIYDNCSDVVSNPSAWLNVTS